MPRRPAVQIHSAYRKKRKKKRRSETATRCSHYQAQQDSLSSCLSLSPRWGAGWPLPLYVEVYIKGIYTISPRVQYIIPYIHAAAYINPEAVSVYRCISLSLPIYMLKNITPYRALLALAQSLEGNINLLWTLLYVHRFPVSSSPVMSRAVQHMYPLPFLSMQLMLLLSRDSALPSIFICACAVYIHPDCSGNHNCALVAFSGRTSFSCRDGTGEIYDGPRDGL